MKNKKPGRDKSVSKLLSLMQDEAAVRSSLTLLAGIRQVLQPSSGVAAVAWYQLCTACKQLTGTYRNQDERQSQENSVQVMM